MERIEEALGGFSLSHRTGKGRRETNRQRNIDLAAKALAPERMEFAIGGPRDGRFVKRDSLVRFAGYQGRQGWLSRTLTLPVKDASIVIAINRCDDVLRQTRVFRGDTFPAVIKALFPEAVKGLTGESHRE